MNLDRVAVRNMRKGPTVLDNPEDSRKYYSWGGHGSIDGSDVVMLPSELVKSSQFEKAQRLGVFQIVKEEEARIELDLQTRTHLDKETAKEEKAKASIDHNANRSIASESCIAPDARGSGKCGQAVIVTKDIPPLCTKHASLQSQYTQTESWENDQKVVTWTRVTIER